MSDIICGCEESQTVTEELRKLNHNAFSCDLLPTSGNHPEWHLQMDIFEALKIKKWDAGIFFPPCDYLTGSGERWIKDQPPLKSGKLVGAERRKARKLAIEFFLKLTILDFPWAIENPIGVMSTVYRKPDQIIQPWMFGHLEQKSTCLWLHKLPKLVETNNVYDEMMKLPKKERERIHYLPPTEDRSLIRSKTFKGVAEAMTQWFK